MIKIAHRGSINGKVLDHRGNENYYKFHDNSMLSYVNAIQQKFDMIEELHKLKTDSWNWI